MLIAVAEVGEHPEPLNFLATVSLTTGEVAVLNQGADFDASPAEDTHKFESRYLDSLIGPWPDSKDLYDERSPLMHADGLSCPVIFFQGLEDRVVPPNQAEKMVSALRDRGVDVEYIAYPGEQHGFRMAETIKDSIERELAFYLKTWDMV